MENFVFFHFPCVRIVDFKIRSMELDSKSIKLQIWGTASQERFRSITANFRNGSHAIAVVYDISNHQSFENIRKWMSDVQNLANPNVCKLLVGNKVDLEDKRVVRKEEGQLMADSLGIPFIETSAKSSENVKEMFTEICKAVSQRQENQPKQGDLPSPKPLLIKGSTVRINDGGCHC
jgi:Ras-related protein Rab-1A